MALLRTIVDIANEHDTVAAEKIVVGHVDHAVRGEDSRSDLAFVEELAKTLNVEFVSVTLDINLIIGDRQNASEDLLREARYAALKKIARDANARYLFTGHHQDDQAETILFRIFRGTGLKGLKGIPAIRRDDWLTVVRPFLEVPKSTILEALTAMEQTFRTDATNASNDFGRNFIRNEILTRARDYFGPHVDDSIVRLARHAGEAIVTEENLVDEFFKKSLAMYELEPNLFSGPSQRLAEQSATLIRAILIRVWQQQGWPMDQMTFERWDSLAEKVKAAQVPVPTSVQTAERYVENLPGNLRFEVDATSVKITSAS